MEIMWGMFDTIASAEESAEMLKASGYNVCVVKEDDNQYKVYIVVDYDYHIARILDYIKTSIKYGNQDISSVLAMYKERLKELPKNLKLEYNPSTNTLHTITNNKEFKITLD